MILGAAGKVLDVTEAGAVRAASTCMRLGAWVVPYCYREECKKLIETRINPLDVLEEEKGLVRDIGNIALTARRAGLPVGAEIRTIAETIGRRVHDADYSHEFDPYQTKLLEEIAPLTHQDKE